MVQERLRRREARPEDECIADEAEETLMAEWWRFEELKKQLTDKMQALGAEISRLRKELQEKELELTDALAGRRIDEKCLEMELPVNTHIIIWDDLNQ